MLFNHGKDVWRRGRSRPQNAGCSHRKREVQAIAQTISKEHFGDTEEAVIFRDIENVLSVQFGAYHHVMVQVNAAFWVSRAAGRIQPERSVIFGGLFGFQVGGAFIRSCAVIPSPPAHCRKRQSSSDSAAFPCNCLYLRKRASLTISTLARESFSMYSYSLGLSSVLIGMGTAPILMPPKKQ